MTYTGKRTKYPSATEAKRRRQKFQGIVTGLSAIILIAASGFALGWWL